LQFLIKIDVNCYDYLKVFAVFRQHCHQKNVVFAVYTLVATVYLPALFSFVYVEKGRNCELS